MHGSNISSIASTPWYQTNNVRHNTVIYQNHGDPTSRSYRKYFGWWREWKIRGSHAFVHNAQSNRSSSFRQTGWQFWAGDCETGLNFDFFCRSAQGSTKILKCFTIYLWRLVHEIGIRKIIRFIIAIKRKLVLMWQKQQS